MRVANFKPLIVRVAFVMAAFLFCSLSLNLSAALPLEVPGTEVLPKAKGSWVWVADGSADFSESRLFNGDTGKMLGMISTGYWSSGLVIPDHGREIYALETHFERSTRGQRTDIVSIMDPTTLTPIAEIVIPPRRMTALTSKAMSILSEDERFLIIQNFTPAQSVSIVDLQQRSFVTELDTPGCNGLYRSGPRGFNVICGDGSLLWVALDDDGKVIDQGFSKAFFEPEIDPVSVASVRIDGIELFASNAGKIYPVNMNQQLPRGRQSWRFISAAEFAEGWRYGGFNRLAVHKPSRTLYILMQEGGDESYEDPATELWVFDLDTRQRRQRISLKHMALGIEVSEDEVAKIYTTAITFPLPQWSVVLLAILGYEKNLGEVVKFGLDVYDAKTLQHLRTIKKVSTIPTRLQVW